MLLDMEKEKENFKDHVATFTDYGNIKILDFKNPKSSHYRIRFMFEEDYYRLHISGDLGELIAVNFDNMCYERFTDFIDSPVYFEKKVRCCNRPLYEYDSDIAHKELEEHLEDCTFESDFKKECFFEDVFCDFAEDYGFGTFAYSLVSEKDPDCDDYIIYLGRVRTGILELYLLAFELAQKQLAESKNLESIGERQHD